MEHIKTYESFLNEGNRYSPIKSVNDSDFDQLIKNWNEMVKDSERSSDPYRVLADKMGEYIVKNFEGQQKSDLAEYLEKTLLVPPYSEKDRMYAF